jgi:hypothetical protein
MSEELEHLQSFLPRFARRIGDIAPTMQRRINALSVYQLVDLTEALWKFSEPADLANWLDENDDEICASLESKFLR